MLLSALAVGILLVLYLAGMGGPAARHAQTQGGREDGNVTSSAESRASRGFWSGCLFVEWVVFGGAASAALAGFLTVVLLPDSTASTAKPDATRHIVVTGLVIGLVPCVVAGVIGAKSRWRTGTIFQRPRVVLVAAVAAPVAIVVGVLGAWNVSGDGSVFGWDNGFHGEHALLDRVHVAGADLGTSYEEVGSVSVPLSPRDGFDPSTAISVGTGPTGHGPAIELRPQWVDDDQWSYDAPDPLNAGGHCSLWIGPSVVRGGIELTADCQ